VITVDELTPIRLALKIGWNLPGQGRPQKLSGPDLNSYYIKPDYLSTCEESRKEGFADTRGFVDRRSWHFDRRRNAKVAAPSTNLSEGNTGTVSPFTVILLATGITIPG
jgi:hypothetical protein